MLTPRQHMDLSSFLSRRENKIQFPHKTTKHKSHGVTPTHFNNGMNMLLRKQRKKKKTEE